MIDPHAAGRDYCFDEFLTLWERWTDGNPAMRRALDCDSADPRTHQERRAALMDAVVTLMARGTGPGEAAAAAAGLAVLAVLSGEQGDAGYEDLRAVVRRHDAEALQRERERGPRA